MGSYTSFKINGYEIFSDKNSYSHEIMSLFSEDMKVDEVEEINGHLNSTIYYSASISDFIRRLDIMGYTYERAISDFNNSFDKGEYFSGLDEEIFVPEEICINYFVEKLEFMIEKSLHYWDFIDSMAAFDDLEINESELEIIKYIFTYMTDEYLLGIPLRDIKNLLRVILKISDKDGKVIYDVSDIIDSGYFDKDYEFVTSAKEKMYNSHYTYGSTIVITEGSSDKNILEKALSYLYPNQSDLFSFFDYKASNSPGSTSEVIKIIKSFIASKIINKTVVMFDNDTAGREAIEEISKISLPPNIKILRYPDINICTNYPTIGPQGTQCMNINGLAASIELYLGDSILRYEKGLTPIQWIGYRDKIKQYQGQITNKLNLQRKFFELFKYNPQNIDWGDLDKILKELFNAYMVNQN